MKQPLLSFQEAKRISIHDYLAGLGFEPAKIRGNDHWYYSPFRDERTPSFKVNTTLNLWYDHGSGEGGTILDLGARLHQCSMVEFLEKLANNSTEGFRFHQQPTKVITPENKIEIISINELKNVDLIQYLGTRGIDAMIARKFCKEIDFRIGSRAYKAIGFPNRSGAYELRNNWFKGSSSPKDISLIETGSTKISVLEGFMDFLSLQKISHPTLNRLSEGSDFLILNSLSLLKRSLPLLSSRRNVILFLDNDLAAKDAMDVLTKAGIPYVDASPQYGSHKDLNEYLQSLAKENRSQELPRKKNRGLRR